MQHVINGELNNTSPYYVIRSLMLSWKINSDKHFPSLVKEPSDILTNVDASVLQLSTGNFHKLSEWWLQLPILQLKLSALKLGFWADTEQNSRNKLRSAFVRFKFVSLTSVLMHKI
jgi:hypothetical protein